MRQCLNFQDMSELWDNTVPRPRINTPKYFNFFLFFEDIGEFCFTFLVKNAESKNRILI